MAAKKTLYVPDQDAPMWKELEELSGENASALVARLLNDELERLREIKKAREGKFSKIVIEYKDNDGTTRKVAFTGRWIVEEYKNNGTYYSVAISEKFRLFVLIKDNRGAEYQVHDSFETMQDFEGKYPGGLLALVADYLKEDYVEELDI